MAPVAVGSIPAQALTAGQAITVDVTPFFRDPDGGTLSYSAASSNEAVVSVSLSGSNLTVEAVSAGTATVTVTATDPDGLTATQSADITVEAANQAPEAVGTIPAQTMTAGQTATVDVSPFFSDPDGDDLTYAAESSNTDAVTVSISGSSLAVTAVSAGTATLTVTAADPDGLTATQSAEVTVEAANQAPEAVGTIPAQTMTVGQTATVDVSPFFSDPDGDDLTYAAESSNTDAVTVSISGSSLAVTAVSAGTATLTVTAADPDGLTATQSADITVEAANQAPEAVGTIPAQTMTVGQTATVDVSPFFSDPDGDDLTYAAESSNTDAVTVSISGSSLAVTAVSAGTATLTVTAADPDGLTATQSADITVEAANQAPEAVGTIPAQTMTVGQTATVDVSPFFSDPDGDDLTYAAESSNTDAVTVSISGSSLAVTAVSAGTATLTVTAADPDGLTATQSADITVEAANQAPKAGGRIPSQTLTVGDQVTVDVSPLFSDPDGDDLTYAAESSNTDAVAVSMSGSILTVTAVRLGRATATVTASDPDGLTAARSARVTVAAGFRDDFDTGASLDDWGPFHSHLEVVDGVLHVTHTGTEPIGTADRVLETPLTDWELSTSMARSATDGVALAYWVTGHPRFRFFRFTIWFRSGRYILGVWDEQILDYVPIPHFSGNSDAISAAPNEFTDITFLHKNGEFALIAGDTELFRVRSSDFPFRGGELSDMLHSVEAIWLGTIANQTVLFDWAYLTGTESSARVANKPGAPGIDSPHLLEDLNQARLGNPTAPPRVEPRASGGGQRSPRRPPPPVRWRP